MLDALVLGGVAQVSLLLSGLPASRVTVPRRIIGWLAGFGAGALVSAITFDLTEQAEALGGVGLSVWLLIGAAVFLVGDYVVERRFGAGGGSGAMGIVVGSIVDGVPESLIFGIGIAAGSGVSTSFLAAVIVSNVPQALAPSAELSAAGWSWQRLSVLWGAVVVACALAAGLGYLLGSASGDTGDRMAALAAGGLLAMLTNSLMPFAFDRGGRLAGMFTVVGFALAVPRLATLANRTARCGGPLCAASSAYPQWSHHLPGSPTGQETIWASAPDRPGRTICRMDARARAAAWDREHRPECIADVPLSLKEDLAALHQEPDRPADRSTAADLAAAPTILVNFAASPHGGHWRPLPDHGHEPPITMRTVIHHSIVGSAEGAWQYFASGTAIESTFIVKKSGYFWQIMSLGEQADANFLANAFAGSIETEDNGHPDTDPWTPAQIDTLVWLSLEMRRLRPAIARRKCRSWDDAGLGYHSLFPNQWSNVPGKTCPGRIRIRQWESTVLPRYLAGPVEEDTDMTSEQARQLKEVYQALIVPGTTNPSQTVDLLFARVRNIEQALIVPGTTTAEEAFDLLFARVRNIENIVEGLQPAAAATAQIDYDLLADKVAERLSRGQTQ